MITVRAAELKDLDWLLDQLRSFSEFIGTKKKLFDDYLIARTGLIRLMKDHIVYVAIRTESMGAPQPVGLIAGVTTPHLLNPKLTILAELFWWVAPEHRGTPAALMLMEKFLECAEGLGVDWVTFAVEGHSPVREDSLTKRGFRLQERSYLLEMGV